MRGKAGRARRGACPLRITPAHAGKRPGLALLLPRTGDHPRTCGEKSRAKMELSRNQGSPPHMRGKENRCGHAYQTYGITPAHAGKRLLGWTRTLSRRDHPRTCGEKHEVPVHSAAHCGSPPHMRGKEPAQNTSLLRAGITPAHAGKSGVIIWEELHIKDHPRTCGEKPQRENGGFLVQGSPPHMRGKGQR